MMRALIVRQGIVTKWLKKMVIVPCSVPSIASKGFKQTSDTVRFAF